MSKGSFAQLRLAKIAAWQAILVALITTFGGALVGALAGRTSERTKTGQTQRCLTILGVKPLSGAEDINRVHISGSVSSLATFAYPTEYPWQELTAEMPVARLPLPATEGTLRVNFSGFAEDANGQIFHLCGLDSQKLTSRVPVEEGMAFLARGTPISFGTTHSKKIPGCDDAGARFALAYRVERCVDVEAEPPG